MCQGMLKNTTEQLSKDRSQLAHLLQERLAITQMIGPSEQDEKEFSRGNDAGRTTAVAHLRAIQPHCSG